MRLVTYRDEDGRIRDVLLPEGAPDEHAPMGILVGPPDLTDLDLPLPLEVSLNNELHARRIFTAQDVRRRTADVARAVDAARRVVLDTSTVINHYLRDDHEQL